MYTADHNTSSLTPYPAERDPEVKIFECESLWLHFLECKFLLSCMCIDITQPKMFSPTTLDLEAFRDVSDTRPADETRGCHCLK